MAKERNRGNREAKKPKKVKTPQPLATASFANAGMAAQLAKKK